MGSRLRWGALLTTCLGLHFCFGLTACAGEKDTSSKDAEDDDGGKKKKKKKKKKKPKDDDEEKEAASDDDGDAKPAADPEPATPTWKVGDAVDVEWKKQWWKATVLSVESDDKYKIHYVGWSSSWDEVVPSGRVRARTATAKQGTQTENENPGGSNDSLPQTEPAPAVPTPAPGKEASPFVGKGGKPPSMAEWNAQTKEVVVHGSTARACETKMVRGWLRVSCRGEPKGFGKPVSLSIASGGTTAQHFEFANAAVTSLVVRFEPGVDMKIDFAWERKRSRLHVFWPRASPEPAYKGKFADI